MSPLPPRSSPAATGEPGGRIAPLVAEATRLLGFAAISGGGLALDFLLFLVLVHGGLTPAAANLASATAAVGFVYFTSARRVFAYRGDFLIGLFLAYLGWQAVAVSAGSWAIGALVGLGLSPAAAKLVILPITFPANYLVMRLLTRHRPVLEPST